MLLFLAAGALGNWYRLLYQSLLPPTPVSTTRYRSIPDDDELQKHVKAIIDKGLKGLFLHGRKETIEEPSQGKRGQVRDEMLPGTSIGGAAMDSKGSRLDRRIDSMPSRIAEVLKAKGGYTKY